MTGELWDLPAERALLAAVWAGNGRMIAETEITGEDFQHVPHARIWQAFTEMWATGSPFDLATLQASLGEDFGRTAQALADITTAGVAAQSATWHANTLIRLTAHRRAVVAADRIKQRATGEADPEELAEFARGQIDAAMALRGAKPVETWADQLDRALDRWQSPITDAIPTGWHDLDSLLSGGGLRPGHLIVIGARPGQGKSLIATMLSGKVASTGRGVYFASAEMSSDELTDRIAAAATGVNLADLTNRRLDAEKRETMHFHANRIRHWPLTLDDRVSSVADIRRGARNQTRRQGGLGLVIVDYLQLLEPADKGKTPRHEEVAGMSRSLKLMAKEFGIPVVMLSQLNRGSVRDGRQPMISDLRESGAVEQDADEIILLHRDDDDPELAGQIQLHLAKNRHGAVGYVNLGWQPYVSRITNLRTLGSGGRVAAAVDFGGSGLSNQMSQTVNQTTQQPRGATNRGEPISVDTQSDLRALRGSGVQRSTPRERRFEPKDYDDAALHPDEIDEPPPDWDEDRADSF